MILIFGFFTAQAAEKTVVTQSTEEYLLLPEDVLSISVWKEEGLQQQVVIQPDGGLSFPLVGHIQAAGKTLIQVEEEIKKKINKYIPDALVNVALTKVGGNKVYIIGKVNRPGEYPMGRNIDVMQALALAGGLTPFAAANDIKIIRKIGGESQVYPFYYKAIANHGSKLHLNIQLQSGDVVVVP